MGNGPRKQSVLQGGMLFSEFRKESGLFGNSNCHHNLVVVVYVYQVSGQIDIESHMELLIHVSF